MNAWFAILDRCRKAFERWFQLRGFISQKQWMNQICRFYPIHSHSLPQRCDEQPDCIDEVPEYRRVMEAVNRGTPVTFVTGQAGTGKTTLVRYLQDHIKQTVVLTTGSALTAEITSMSLNCFFGIRTHRIFAQAWDIPPFTMWPVIEKVQAIVIYDVSMLTPGLVDSMHIMLSKVRQNSSPFGGVPIVLIGDLLALGAKEPVSTCRLLRYSEYETRYFFSAHIFKQVDILPIELKKVFYQQHPHLLRLLQATRYRRSQREALRRLNRSCYLGWREPPPGTVTLASTNLASRYINRRHLNQLPSSQVTYKATMSDGIRSIIKQTPAPRYLALKIGAQVVFVTENKPFWRKGTVGRVIELEAEAVEVELLPEGSRVRVAPQTWHHFRYRYHSRSRRIEGEVIDSFTQLPLSLGWAVSFSESGGMILDSVLIDPDKRAFRSGCIYRALSRCRSLDGITLEEPIAMGHVIADPALLAFHERLGLRDDPRRQYHAPGDPSHIIISCGWCDQYLRIPLVDEAIRATCPTCGHQFTYDTDGMVYESASRYREIN